jgi:hypothetical protein
MKGDKFLFIDHKNIEIPQVHQLLKVEANLCKRVLQSFYPFGNHKIGHVIFMAKVPTSKHMTKFITHVYFCFLIFVLSHIGFQVFIFVMILVTFFLI